MWPKKALSVFWWPWSIVEEHMGLNVIRVAAVAKSGDIFIKGRLEIRSLGRLENFIIKELLTLIIRKNVLHGVHSYFLELEG